MIYNQVLKENVNYSQRNFRVQYEDDCGDKIQVSDDEDLMAAYEWAET